MVSQALLDSDLIGCEELEQDMSTLLSKQAHRHEPKMCMWPYYLAI